jgi:hypothetical protein
MRRRPQAVLITLALLVWPASALAQDSEVVVPEGQAGPPHIITVEIPSGAAPAGTDIAVVRRDPDERPDELSSLPLENPFYELQPLDLRFSEPVTVTRLLMFEQFGIVEFDPGAHGYPAASMFARNSDGSWTWLADTVVQIDDGTDPAFAVTGSTDHGGPMFGYFGGSLIVAPDDPPEADVGEIFRVEGQLHGPPGTEANVAGVTGSTSDPSIATPGTVYDIEIFDRAAGIEFECLAPGTVSYEVTFAATEVADVGPHQSLIDVGGVGVHVVHTGDLTCLE